MGEQATPVNRNLASSAGSRGRSPAIAGGAAFSSVALEDPAAPFLSAMTGGKGLLRGAAGFVRRPLKYIAAIRANQLAAFSPARDVAWGQCRRFPLSWNLECLRKHLDCPYRPAGIDNRRS
jgi:hypothetical protein